MCRFLCLDDATILQRKNAIGAIENTIVVGHEPCCSAARGGQSLQKINDILRISRQVPVGPGSVQPLL